MKKLEIVHPAAKTLVDISLSQDAEAGVRITGLALLAIPRRLKLQMDVLLLREPSLIRLPPAQVGDGTTTVVILAGEFLKAAKPFIEENVHPRV